MNEQIKELQHDLRHARARRDFHMKETTRLRHELAVMKQTYKQLFQHHQELLEDVTNLRGMRQAMIEERTTMPKEEPKHDGQVS